MPTRAAAQTTYVALLRGINIGASKRVPMAQLRALLSGLGYADVTTLLNSGNAVFRAAGSSAAQHAAAIAAAIERSLGFEVPVIVKSGKELAAITAGNPLAGAAENPSRLLVAFVQDPRQVRALEFVRALAAPPERFSLGTHAAYLLCPAGVLKSEAGEALLGKAGGGVTTRNWATVLKLAALMDGCGG